MHVVVVAASVALVVCLVLLQVDSVAVAVVVAVALLVAVCLVVASVEAASAAVADSKSCQFQ